MKVKTKEVLLIVFAAVASVMASTDVWPDGTVMDSWFADRSPVDEAKLGRQYFVSQMSGVKANVPVLQTKPLQKAIDSIASQGGGVLVLGPGVWNTSALFFKPGVHLKLEKDAVLRGPEDGSAVPSGMTHFVGHSFVYTLALVNADACDGFTIYGEGTIDGNGKKSWADFWKKRKTVRGFRDWDIPRPRNVYVSNSRDVRISGVAIKDSHFWTVQFYKCERVKVDNVRITAPGRRNPPAAPSSDAIDLDAVKDAHVWGAYMDVNDDAVVMKGGWGYKCETLPDNGANFNILVEDCVFGPVCHHAFTCGSDAFHCRNLILRNSEVRGCGALLNLKSRPDTKQLYEHILVENVSGWCGNTMRMCPWMQWSNLPKDVGKQETCATNVVFRNCNVKGKENIKLDPSFMRLEGYVPPSAVDVGAEYDFLSAPEAPFRMPAVPVWRVPSREFLITDYGAVTGAVKNTEAFAKAITACSAAGGGRVVVPKGDWRTGAIHLKSNVALDLREGSCIVFTDNPADYLPAVHTNWEGVEAMGYSPLIFAYGCTNVAIVGKGRIAPETNLWRKEWDNRDTPMHKAFIATLYDWCSMDIPLAKRDITRFSGSHAKPHLIQINRSANILLEDFLIRGSPFWNVHLFHSENVVVRGIDICSHGHNTDGIDIDMTKNVIVENCIFDQGDDAIVLKAARNHDAWRLGRCTENVVVRNCTVRNGHVLLGIGSDVSGGIRNVFMHDCRMAGQVLNVFYVKTNERRGGFVENIYMKDCSVELRGSAVPTSVVGIETDVLYEWRNLPTWDVRVTRIRNICAENVRVPRAKHLLMVYGDARDPVDGVTLKNVACGETTEERLVVVNAKNVTMDGVPLQSRPGKAPAR